MSQTSFNFAKRIAHNLRSNNTIDIKFTYYLSNNTMLNRVVNRTELVSKLQILQHQGKGRPRHWWQKLAFNAQAAALVITISTLPMWVNRSNAYNLTNQSVTELKAQVPQPNADNPVNTGSSSPSQISLTLALETVVAILLLIGLLTAFLANRAIRPVKIGDSKKDEKLNVGESDASTQLATADSKAGIDEENIDLSMQLATPGGFGLSQARVTEQQADEVDQAKLLTEITLRIRQSQYLEDLLRTTVKEVRRALNTDRVIIYGLDPKNLDGTVVAESVTPGWPQTLRVRLNDPCFKDRHAEMYKQGQITAINDIYQEPRVTDCYRKMLEQFAVKANLVAPILKNEQLLGLLIAHQCSAPRTWEQSEIDLIAQLAIQVSFAIDQVNFVEQQEMEAERAQLVTEITLRLRQSQSLEDLLRTGVKEVRRALKADRVIIFGLDSTDWSGIVVAESVAIGWPQTLRVRIDDPCFKNRLEMYKNGQVTAVNDIYQDPRVTDCYRQMLEQFAVKANLAAPILKNNQVLGLLIAHQCSAPRVWAKSEIDLFTQLAIQISFSIDQVSLIEQLEPEELI